MRPCKLSGLRSRSAIAGAASVTAILLSPAAAVAAATTPNIHEAGEEGRYGFLIAFVLLVVPSVIAWYISRARAKNKGSGELARGFRQLLVGVDNRVSTSKTVAALWTYLIAIGLLSIIFTKWLGHGEAFGTILHGNLDAQYGLLIGGPIGAAILSKAIVTSQVSNDPSTKTTAPTGPGPKDLIANDVGDTDLGDLQYVLFNAVAVIFFVGTLLQSPQSGLPHLPDVLLGLTSVSAAGYVAKKALPSPTATAKLSQASGKAGVPLTITGTGLLANQIDVKFGSHSASHVDQDSVGDADTLTLTPPDGLNAGEPVDVVVITAAGAQVDAGKFTLTA